ncbi:MAG: hypothetical protein EBX52_13185, partial [Proteobacteria bacterium]|nr:hypothetical protein [Pseudomonadota bacterium]
MLSGGSPLPTSIGNVFQIPVRFSAQGVLGTVRKYTVSSLRDRLGMADSENFAAASVLPVPGLPENSLQSVETLSESGTSWTGNPIALATLPANNSHPNGLIAFVDADENLTVRNRDEIFLQGHPIDQCLSGESAPTPCSHFARTSALAFSEDGGSLFIAGVDPQNGYPGVVRRITISQSPTVTSVLTSAILFSQLSTSSFTPRGLVEHAGTIYVSDTDNHVILSASVDSPASTLQVYAGSLSESGDPNNNTGALNQARFGLPGLLSGFTVEGSFFLLVPDDSSSVITRIDTAAATVSVLNPGNSPVFAGPSMAVRGADGFIYVSGPGSYRVFRFDPATGTLDRTLGQEENHEHQDGIGLEAAFTGPRMLARAPVGKGMLVMDEPHGVFQGGIRLIQDVPDCPNEASGEVSGSRTFNPGDRCSVSVAIFDPGAYDTLHVELGVEAGGEW